MKYIYFGTPEFSKNILEKLCKNNLIPSLIITNKDRKSGRGMKLQIQPLALFANENNIPLLQIDKIDEELINNLKKEKWDFFLIIAFGKILPKELLEITNRNINLHPSLLPKLRGASPLEHSILLNQKENAGITLIEMDEKMDHGDIIAQESFNDIIWPPSSKELYFGFSIIL